MCFLFQPVDVFFASSRWFSEGFFVVKQPELGLSSVVLRWDSSWWKNTSPRGILQKGMPCCGVHFAKEKKRFFRFSISFSIQHRPTCWGIIWTCIDIYIYYIYYNMPRPSKSVKFQPLGLFLVVKWGTNFTPLEDSGWFGHKLSETQRRWFPSWLPHLFPFLQLSHSIHGHGYIYLHEHHNTFTKCR